MLKEVKPSNTHACVAALTQVFRSWHVFRSRGSFLKPASTVSRMKYKDQ